MTCLQTLTTRALMALSMPTLLSAAATLTCLLALPSIAAAEAEDVGKATLTIEDFLRLQRAEDAQKDPEYGPPPVPLAYEAFELSGRILGEVFEGKAQLTLKVLKGGWVAHPVLTVADGVELSLLEVPEGTALGREGKSLVFYTQNAGTHLVTLGLRIAGTASSRREQVFGFDLEVGDVALISARVEPLASGLRLLGHGRGRGDATARIAGANGRLHLEWQRLTPLVPVSEHAAEEVPELQAPAVAEGHASVVLTLDGRRITRYHYRVALQEQAELGVRLPAGQTVTKAFVNGRLIPAASDLSFTLTPRREGEQSATLELVCEEAREALTLAGTLRFSQPTLSLDGSEANIDELRARLFLPQVFAYAWSGGSLSPAQSYEAPSFTWAMPTPGMTRDFTQSLVLGSADLVLDYTVDLAGQYFR